ncbi:MULTISPECIES: hypothetical protein [unclassified Nonomuraea]|uniref:hypothetical protein n=1 Tax=unclassified Nonomuraea TaxID=2593643 RepID=UPI0032DA4713
MMDRRALLTAGGAAAGLALFGSASAAGAAPATTPSKPTERRAGVYPDVVDTSHASQQAAAFFRSYFTAKSLHYPDAFMEHFLRSQVGYYDAALGGSVVMTDWTTMKEALTQAMSSWGAGALSYRGFFPSSGSLAGAPGPTSIKAPLTSGNANQGLLDVSGAVRLSPIDCD